MGNRPTKQTKETLQGVSLDLMKQYGYKILYVAFFNENNAFRSLEEMYRDETTLISEVCFGNGTHLAIAQIKNASKKNSRVRDVQSKIRFYTESRVTTGTSSSTFSLLQNVTVGSCLREIQMPIRREELETFLETLSPATETETETAPITTTMATTAIPLRKTDEDRV